MAKTVPPVKVTPIGFPPSASVPDSTAELTVGLDRSLNWGNVTIPGPVVVRLIEKGGIILVPVPKDGPTQIHAGMAQISAALDPLNPPKMLDGTKTLLGGVHTVLEVGAPYMVTSDKGHKADGLPEAGFSATDVMTQYPNQSWNARDTVKPDQLRADSSLLQTHFGFQDLYTNCQVRVSRGVSFLADRVFVGAGTVNKVIADVVPVNDALAEAARNMTSYFRDSIIKSLGTRKANKKNKEKTAAEVTLKVKDQAVAEAKQEAQSEVFGALQNLINKKSST